VRDSKKFLEINSHRLNARRSNAPTGETDHQTGEAGHNGGNSEPNRESLLAEMSMSKETESATEPSSLTTAYIRLLAEPKGKDKG